jgi:hypothetical protein
LVKIDDWASLVKAILIVFTNSPWWWHLHKHKYY